MFIQRRWKKREIFMGEGIPAPRQKREKGLKEPLGPEREGKSPSRGILRGTLPPAEREGGGIEKRRGPSAFPKRKKYFYFDKKGKAVSPKASSLKNAHMWSKMEKKKSFLNR